MIFAHTPSEILPYRKCLQTEFLGDGFNNISGCENDKMSKMMTELSVLSEIQNSQETLRKNQQKLEQSISEFHNNRMQSEQHQSQQQQNQEQQQNQQQQQPQQSHQQRRNGNNYNNIRNPPTANFPPAKWKEQ